jgi:hypothetical protein
MKQKVEMRKKRLEKVAKLKSQRAKEKEGPGKLQNKLGSLL